MNAKVPRMFEGSFVYPDNAGFERRCEGGSSAQPSDGYGWGYGAGEEPEKRKVSMGELEDLADLISPFRKN